MGMLVGFHVEGNDYLILKAFLAKLLEVGEDEIIVDHIDHPGLGWQAVLEFAPKALKRFYNQCAQFAVVGLDNDGNENLAATGKAEDPAHPRHANHPAAASPLCRLCRLQAIVANLRPDLTWLPQKPGATWPILIAVPVEMIETWLLICRAITNPGEGSINAEREERSNQKQRLYGNPAATRADIESTALPLVRSLTAQHLARLREVSPSFQIFATQVSAERARIVGPRDCWQEGDGAAERQG